MPCIHISARHFLRQIVEGLLYLHSHNIVHRDLTLRNLLLTQDMDVVCSLTLLKLSKDRSEFKFNISLFHLLLMFTSKAKETFTGCNA